MIQKLIEKIQKTKAPICVGSGPNVKLYPGAHFQRSPSESSARPWRARQMPSGSFNKEIVDHTWDLIPSVKPQIAMYEQFGIEGLKAYDKTDRNTARRRDL